MSAKFACSRAISRPSAGCSAKGRRCRSRRTTFSSTLIGTTYGGDGQETFNLPNLASRVPIHMGTGPDGTTYQLGEMAGTEQETLTTQQIPVHNHPEVAANAAGTDQPSPTGKVLAQAVSSQPTASSYLRCPTAPRSDEHRRRSSPPGGSQPHENTQPFLVINFIISLFGVFPSQT